MPSIVRVSLTVVLVVAAAGCTGSFWGMCNGDEGSILAQSMFDAQWTEENRTRVRDALATIGYEEPPEVSHAFPTLWMERDDTQVIVQGHANTTVDFRFDGPWKEGNADDLFASEHGRLQAIADEAHAHIVSLTGWNATAPQVRLERWTC